MRSTQTAITRHREILDALADCAQAGKDLDTAWKVHYATIRKALEEGTNAKDLAARLGVSRAAIYQLAANGQGLDAGLFPPAEDELISVPFDGYPNGITVPAYLSSRLDVYRAEERLKTYAARAHDSKIRHVDIANTIGCSTEAVSDLLDRHRERLRELRRAEQRAHPTRESTQPTITARQGSPIDLTQHAGPPPNYGGVALPDSASR